jgi:hypothetical protein
VARVSDDGYEELWTYETAEVSPGHPPVLELSCCCQPLDLRVMFGTDEQEDHYHIAWSYDPITFRPILASGGTGRIVWLFDHWLQRPYKIFKGHGNVSRYSSEVMSS